MSQSVGTGQRGGENPAQKEADKSGAAKAGQSPGQYEFPAHSPDRILHCFLSLLPPQLLHSALSSSSTSMCLKSWIILGLQQSPSTRHRLRVTRLRAAPWSNTQKTTTAMWNGLSLKNQFAAAVFS